MTTNNSDTQPTERKYRLTGTVHPETVARWFLDLHHYWFDESFGPNMFTGQRDDAFKYLDTWIKTGEFAPDRTTLEIHVRMKFDEWLASSWQVQVTPPPPPTGETRHEFVKPASYMSIQGLCARTDCRQPRPAPVHQPATVEQPTETVHCDARCEDCEPACRCFYDPGHSGKHDHACQFREPDDESAQSVTPPQGCADHCEHDPSLMRDGMCWAVKNKIGVCGHRCAPAAPEPQGGALARIAIVSDKEGRWYVRRIRLVEHDLDRDEKVYRCDLPIGGPYSSLANVPMVAAATPPPTADEIETWFKEGERQGEDDEAKPQTPCPYAEETLARRWWTRGYAYASRLLRAYKAEGAIPKAFAVALSSIGDKSLYTCACGDVFNESFRGMCANCVATEVSAARGAGDGPRGEDYK